MNRKAEAGLIHSQTTACCCPFDPSVNKHLAKDYSGQALGR